MTRRVLVTRADGSPAYVNAQPRLRQSHIDKWREVARRAREPVGPDDLPECVSFLVERQSSVTAGTAMTLAVVAAWAGFFMFLP